MGLVLALLVCALIGTVWAVVTRDRRARREQLHEQAFERVAEELGLTRSTPWAAHGTVGGHRLEIEHHPAWRGDRADVRTRLRLWSHALPRDLALRSLLLVGDGGEERVTTGDAAFDATVHVSGASAARVSARLDATTRDLVRRAVGLGATFGRGTWLLDLPGTLGPDQEVPATVTLLARCADVLARPVDLPGALLARAVRDPLPSVRSVAAHRLVAAVSGGVLDREERALDRLERHADPTVRLAVAELGGSRGARIRRALLEHDRRDLRARAAVELARGAAPGADLALEQVLVDLAPDGDPEVVRALGRIGTVRSVAVLRAVQAAALPLTELSRAATDALREVRGRVVGQRGTLSVPRLDGGELADAHPASAGRVAVAG